MKFGFENGTVPARRQLNRRGTYDRGLHAVRAHGRDQRPAAWRDHCIMLMPAPVRPDEGVRRASRKVRRKWISATRCKPHPCESSSGKGAAICRLPLMDTGQCVSISVPCSTLCSLFACSAGSDSREPVWKRGTRRDPAPSCRACLAYAWDASFLLKLLARISMDWRTRPSALVCTSGSLGEKVQRDVLPALQRSASPTCTCAPRAGLMPLATVFKHALKNSLPSRSA